MKTKQDRILDVQKGIFELLEAGWFLRVYRETDHEALLYSPEGEIASWLTAEKCEGPYPVEYYEQLISSGQLVVIGDNRYTLPKFAEEYRVKKWPATHQDLLIETMTNQSCELVIVMDPGHPAYLRDAVTKEAIYEPFEHEDYQPLIDSGQLVESGEFCSVFVLSAAATPPDFANCDLGQIQGEEGGQHNG